MPLSTAFAIVDGQRTVSGSSSATVKDKPVRTNPTIFTDDQMLSWQPLFLIRHPLAVYSSWYRAEGSLAPDLDTAISRMYMTLRFQREILDWYLAQRQQDSREEGTRVPAPIVLDADDIILSRPDDPDSPLHQLAFSLHMDPSRLLFSWPAEEAARTAGAGLDPELQEDERVERFLSTIRKSTGLDSSKVARAWDRETCARELTMEFGNVKAEKLLRRVEESQEDWDYLCQFCIR
ncbi:hypothetical protein KC367_g4175 [Hortaea werneckii]|nr:hypothetical protein KC358_g3515 [Hortaea werneckii]KAI6851901.1 hypothetical protein KC350_g1377 [Hortaea werneckii]KAI6943254.1 hypothetical protein KC341_g1613 [Hortaea werneckii]KAI6949073.1 hypothetical protein KC348_g1572 [Hortaea werneckii]KAI6981052.1 hypothetical protein KC321_g1458 [Hortaea werneckii]